MRSVTVYTDRARALNNSRHVGRLRQVSADPGARIYHVDISIDGKARVFHGTGYGQDNPVEFHSLCEIDEHDVQVRILNRVEKDPEFAAVVVKNGIAKLYHGSHIEAHSIHGQPPFPDSGKLTLVTRDQMAHNVRMLDGYTSATQRAPNLDGPPEIRHMLMHVYGMTTGYEVAQLSCRDNASSDAPTSIHP